MYTPPPVQVASVAVAPVIIGATVAGVGGYYLYNAFLKNDKAQEYNQLHTKLANGDYLSSAEDNSSYDINNNDDRIGIFDKKKHGNVDPKLKAKFKDASAQSATGMPEPDDEPDNNEKDHLKEYYDKLKKYDKFDGDKIKYEQSGKHGHQSRGDISKAPTDPQEALKNAFKVKDYALNDNNRQIISFDFKNKEIVIFNRTNGNVYHGHAIENIKALSREQQNAVRFLTNNSTEIKNLVKLLTK